MSDNKQGETVRLELTREEAEAARGALVYALADRDFRASHARLTHIQADDKLRAALASHVGDDGGERDADELFVRLTRKQANQWLTARHSGIEFAITDAIRDALDSPPAVVDDGADQLAIFAGCLLDPGKYVERRQVPDVPKGQEPDEETSYFGEALVSWQMHAIRVALGFDSAALSDQPSDTPPTDTAAQPNAPSVADQLRPSDTRDDVEGRVEYRVIGDRGARSAVVLDPSGQNLEWAIKAMRPFLRVDTYSNVRIQSRRVIETEWVDLPTKNEEVG